MLTVGPAGKSGASVSQTAIVSVYLDKVGGAHAPARVRAAQWAERQEAEPRTHPSEGRGPKGGNERAEPRRATRGHSGTVCGAARGRAKDTPERGQRPRGWQRKGRAEARNASAEPRREVEQRSSTQSKSLWSGAEAEGLRRQRCLGAQILDPRLSSRGRPTREIDLNSSRGRRHVTVCKGDRRASRRQGSTS